MGTRGFVGFVADGKETITYVHSDAYPDGVGSDVLTWARSVTDWDEVKRQAAALVHVDDNMPPTPEQIEKLRPYANDRVSTRELKDWYVLLRETQGRAGLILSAGHAEHDPYWPGNSLFCEWGYLVDLDRGVLEVYRGFQEQPHAEGRFHDRPSRHDYYPVRPVASWPLTELPDEAAFLGAADVLA